MRISPLLAAASLALVGIGPACAGVFSVTPVRIFMTPKDRGVAITLTNLGESEIALQADIHIWQQKSDGGDELMLTDDMILSPPILKLAPNARQVVRLALLRPADASRQLTYRMVIREVPEATAPKGSAMEIPISLTLSMPVFVTPPPARREVGCETVRRDARTLHVVCRNTGTAYAQVREIVAKRGGQDLARFEGGNYILPGARKAIPLQAEQPVAAGEVEIAVTFDDGQSQHFSAVLP